MATQAQFLTLRARWTQTVVCANKDKSKECRNDENLTKLGMVLRMENSVNAWSP